MKNKHLLSICLAALVAATGTIGLAGGSLKTPAAVYAADDTNDDWLHCEGSRIYDKDGNEVWLTGANWFGFNCSENCVHYLWSADVDDVLKSVADHGINIIRFPIATELLVSWKAGKPNPVNSVSANADPAFTINPDFCESDGSTSQCLDDYEAEEQFTLRWVSPQEAVHINRTHPHGSKDAHPQFPVMLDRENRVLELLTAQMPDRFAPLPDPPKEW